MRYVRLRKYIVALLHSIRDQEDVQLFYEEVSQHKGTDAAQIYGGIIAVIAEVCESRTPRVPWAGIPVGTIKKHATGKGNAGKEAMIAAAQAKWPRDGLTSDDECDARWIAEAGMEY